MVNKELNKIGLNLNAQKTKLMKVDELAEYYLYYPQLLLDEQNYNKSFEEFYNIYTRNKNVRYDTYIKRIFGNKIGLNKFNLKNQSIIKSIIFDKDFLFFINPIQLKFIYNNLIGDEKTIFIKFLLDIYELTSFNSYHYCLLSFFKNNKLTRYYELLNSVDVT